ncbi:MAG: hypothetical protein WCS73_06800 [Lentisphaeria bacterium]
MFDDMVENITRYRCKYCKKTFEADDYFNPDEFCEDICPDCFYGGEMCEDGEDELEDDIELEDEDDFDGEEELDDDFDEDDDEDDDFGEDFDDDEKSNKGYRE